MSERSADLLAVVAVVVGLLCGVVSLIYKPFLFGAVGTFLVMVAIIATPKHRSLLGIAMLVVGVGFLVGATIASGTGRALY